MKTQYRLIDSVVAYLAGFERVPPSIDWQVYKRSSNKVNCIFIGDSRQVLKNFESNFIDLIHTSPPYNIEKPYAHTADNLKHEEYLHLLTDIFSECYRILKPNSSLFLQTGYCHNKSTEVFPIDMLMYNKMREIGFRLWDRIIWHFRGGVSLSRKFKNTHETILWWIKPGYKEKDQPFFDVDSVREKSLSYDKRNNLLGKNPGNVWIEDRVAFGGMARDTTHIAIYPESITERIIRSCSRKNDVVLDPFAGSGTTPAMARSLGRRWVGVEVSPTYAHEAEERMGRKQASEIASLASHLVKVVSFGNRIETLPSVTVAGKLSDWITSINFVHLKSFRAENIDGFYATDRLEKEIKPSIWQMFDDLFSRSQPTFEHLYLVSTLLDLAYPQRRLWNSVRKFLHSLEILEELCLIMQGQVDRLIESVAECEPTSFRWGSNRQSLEFLGPSLRLTRVCNPVVWKTNSNRQSTTTTIEDSDTLGLDHLLKGEA